MGTCDAQGQKQGVFKQPKFISEIMLYEYNRKWSIMAFFYKAKRIGKVEKVIIIWQQGRIFFSFPKIIRGI